MVRLWDDLEVARFERFVEELLDFLLTRLDEAGFEQLVVHEPQRMVAAHMLRTVVDARREGLVHGLQRCLAHRQTQRTDNPHVMVTKGTKAGRSSASTAYLSHVLDPCGVPPRMLRSTRLVDLVNTMDPKLVAAAFGMDPEGVMIYLADRVELNRLPDPDFSADTST